MGDLDLRVAGQRGYWVLRKPGTGRVWTEGNVLYYDPAIGYYERLERVLTVTRGGPAGSK